jgi:hypothetical protein
MNKLFLLLVLVLGFSCGKGKIKKSSEARQNVSQYFSASSINVNVYYQEGADPYVTELNGSGSLLNFNYWNLLQKNLEALFQGRANVPAIIVPKELSQMTKIDVPAQETWSAEDIINASKSVGMTSSQTSFNVFFVKGRAIENSKIIGFHINETNIIAIFKDWSAVI